MCGGSVTYDPPLCSNSTYAKDTVVTLTAVPSEGYDFEKWTGDVDGVTSTEVSMMAFVMSKARVITVNFTAPAGLFTVTVEATPIADGFVTIDTPCGSLTSDDTQPAISFQCAAGTEVTVTATANAGYRFRGWKGDLASQKDIVDLTVDSDTTITGEFAKASKASQFPWWWVALGVVAVLLAAFALARLIYGRAHKPKVNRRRAKKHRTVDRRS